jgi:hypothetical protein
MIKVDHKLDSNNAAGFRRSSTLAERMLKRANGEHVEKEPRLVEHIAPEPQAHPTSTPPPQVIYTAAPQSENTVTIENKNISFEIAYPHDTKLMSVGLKAMSVDISEDSVSILMQDTVQLKLPKLVPLHLTVNGCPYNVCWAGGSHNFGKFKHISFVIVE